MRAFAERDRLRGLKRGAFEGFMLLVPIWSCPFWPLTVEALAGASSKAREIEGRGEPTGECPWVHLRDGW